MTSAGMMRRTMDHGSTLNNEAHTSSSSHRSQQSLSTTNACDQCHRRKLRCSRHEPTCERCQKQQHVCTYSLSRPVGRPRRSAADGRPNSQRSNRPGTGESCNEFARQGDLHSLRTPDFSCKCCNIDTITTPIIILNHLQLHLN